MPTGFRSMPVLPCQDVEACTAFYVEKLGFKLVNFFKEDGEAMAFAIVSMGTITMALQHAPDYKPFHGWSAYLYINDVRGLAAIAGARGVDIQTSPHETFYGMIEFDLKDPEGHVIAFGQDQNPGAEGPGL